MAGFAIRDLTFTYPNRIKPALRGVTANLEKGQFITIFGPSGCGKTTLLRHLKPPLAPHGEMSGTIDFDGAALSAMTHREQSEKIGFVMQSPDNQLVTDKVWHELAFGLESLGCGTQEIRLKVAEMASFFGIQAWFHQNVAELSGGQKQLLSLASVMAMQPKALILDEPTGQLDPIAAAGFLSTVGKINRELGVTVVMTEHRLEEVLPLSDRVLFMDGGRIIFDGTPYEVGASLRAHGHGMFFAMPAPMRIWAGVPNSLECPVTVRDGRDWIDHFPVIRTDIPGGRLDEKSGITAVELDDIWFRYGKALPDVIKGVSLKVSKGEFLAILGGNGTGKTTALTLVSGINKPYRGRVRLFGQELGKIPAGMLFGGSGNGGVLGVLPQNPQSIFVKKTVRDDLTEILSGKKLTTAEKERRVLSMVRLCEIGRLLDAHPYDLSGGEQQRAALAKVLLLKPQILILDEPTKGLDAGFKQTFAGILRRLNKNNVTIIMVSHDIEFCAEHAGRCAMFFDGSIVSSETPRSFFSGNSFYTTAAGRMARHMLPAAVTADDVIYALGGEVKAKPSYLIDDGDDSVGPEQSVVADTPPAFDGTPLPTRLSSLTTPKKTAVCAAALLFAVTIILLLTNPLRFMVFISGGGDAVTMSEGAEIWLYAGVLLSLCASGSVISGIVWSGREDKTALQTPAGKRKLSGRTLAAAAMILLAIPLTIFIGIYYLGDRKYYFVSMLIILETMLPFVLVFESRKPQARELIIIAVLCAVGVAGRTAFFMLPQFKPVTAVVIIAGVAFGGETGFLVGAVTGFASNMFFGQGPWTPWQMFAFGIIGFLAGVLFRKGFLRRSRIALCTFGGLTTLIIYGMIMDTSTITTYQANPSWQMFALAYIQGIPFNLVHALATVTFLWIIARPMLEKLDRIKVKYGLVE